MGWRLLKTIWVEEKLPIRIWFFSLQWVIYIYIVIYNQEEFVLPYICVQNFHHHKNQIFQNIQDSEKLGTEKHQIRKTSSWRKLILKYLIAGHTVCSLRMDNCNIPIIVISPFVGFVFVIFSQSVSLTQYIVLSICFFVRLFQFLERFQWQY